MTRYKTTEYQIESSAGRKPGRTKPLWPKQTINENEEAFVTERRSYKFTEYAVLNNAGRWSRDLKRRRNVTLPIMLSLAVKLLTWTGEVSGWNLIRNSKYTAHFSGFSLSLQANCQSVYTTHHTSFSHSMKRSFNNTITESYQWVRSSDIFEYI